MADEAIVFAMANPTPEVMPEEIEDVAAVIATGRSDYPNQINNVLAFPGVFRGALDVRAREITDGDGARGGRGDRRCRRGRRARRRLHRAERLQPRGRAAVAAAVAAAAEHSGVARRARSKAKAGDLAEIPT